MEDEDTELSSKTVESSIIPFESLLPEDFTELG